MGIDIYATAAWGIMTTHGKIQATYTQTRQWVGEVNGDRAFEFSPKTGKPNYETESTPPPELEQWEPHIISGDYEPESHDECIIVFSKPPPLLIAAVTSLPNVFRPSRQAKSLKTSKPT